MLLEILTPQTPMQINICTAARTRISSCILHMILFYIVDVERRLPYIISLTRRIDEQLNISVISYNSTFDLSDSDPD